MKCSKSVSGNELGEGNLQLISNRGLRTPRVFNKRH